MGTTVKIEERMASQQKPLSKNVKNAKKRPAKAKSGAKTIANKKPEEVLKSAGNSGKKDAEKPKESVTTTAPASEPLKAVESANASSSASQTVAIERPKPGDPVAASLVVQSNPVQAFADSLITDDQLSAKQPTTMHSRFRVRMAAILLLTYGLTGTVFTTAMFAMLLNGSLDTFPVLGPVIPSLGGYVSIVGVLVLALSIVSVLISLRLIFPGRVFLKA